MNCQVTTTLVERHQFNKRGTSWRLQVVEAQCSSEIRANWDVFYLCWMQVGLTSCCQGFDEMVAKRANCLELVVGHLHHPNPKPSNLMYASCLKALIKFNKTGFRIKNNHCAPTSTPPPPHTHSAAYCQKGMERFPSVPFRLHQRNQLHY